MLEKQSDKPLLKERFSRISRLISQARYELNQAQSQYEISINTEFSNEYLREHVLEQATFLIRTMQSNLLRLENILQEIRLPNSSEIEYRNKLLKEFSLRMSVLADKYPQFRFHGTGYIDTFSIIEYGGIVSSQERGLVRSSFDANGQISVTEPDSVGLSIRDYIEIKDLLLPLGCLFVVLPEDKEDAASGKSYLMKSFRFRDGNQVSERFVCVLASKEALPKVRNTLKKFGYPENKAKEFFEFLESLEKS